MLRRLLLLSCSMAVAVVAAAAAAAAMMVISDEEAAVCAASRDNCVHRYQSNRYSDVETTMFHFKYMFANNVYSSFTLAVHPAEGTE